MDSSHQGIYYRDSIPIMKQLPPRSQSCKPLRYRIEESVCSNFACCGLTLPDLHALLLHYEQVHHQPTTNEPLNIPASPFRPIRRATSAETLHRPAIPLHDDTFSLLSGLSLTDEPFMPSAGQDNDHVHNGDYNFELVDENNNSLLHMVDALDAPASSAVHIPHNKRSRNTHHLHGEASPSALSPDHIHKIFMLARSPGAPLPFSTSYDDNEFASLHVPAHSPQPKTLGQVHQELLQSFFYAHSPPETKPLPSSAILSPLALRQHHPERILLQQLEQRQYEEPILPIGRKSTMSSDSSDESRDENRPYICKYPGCTKRYKNANGLKYHSIHGHLDGAVPAPSPIPKTNEKPYKCPHANCGKRYKNANGLKYHLTHGHISSTGVIKSNPVVSKPNIAHSTIVLGGRVSHLQPPRTSFYHPNGKPISRDSVKEQGGSIVIV
jgi:transcription factor SFP1